MKAPLDGSILARQAAEARLDGASIIVRSLPEDGSEAREATLEPAREIYPASMIKTPLVAAVLADVADGRLALEQTFTVSQSNMTFNDAPSPLHAGATARLDELCDLSISRSDNVATNVLFDVVGRERATGIVRERYGLSHTAFHRKLSGSDPLIADPGWDGVHRNAHPTRDAATLFTLVALDRVPRSDILRGALVRQYWNDKLSKGVRPGDRFAHKTGDTNDVTHDGGILMTAEGRSYVVVVYTPMSSTDAHNARFKPFMAALRKYL
ncbi:MAG: class A beta-lactamase-related serine hydrolase [Candidatus Eremiobacteraeota bacterium]|nr:class A beta-lactamase-related serine hydrolase [Candidatus Eremiobacteraeota bacterium]